MSTRPSSPSLSLYRNIAVSFSAVTVLLLLTIIYFSVAHATIVVTPTVQTFPLTTNIMVVRVATPGATALVGSVFERDVSEKGSFQTTLLRDEDAKASGTVRLVNTTGNAQRLIATTRLLTRDNILFRLQEGVVVPAKGSVTATVVADRAGGNGEVAPTRFVLPGLREDLQDKIYGESTTSMSGGRRGVYQLTENDIARARTALQKRAEANVRATLAHDISTDAYTLITFDTLSSALDKKLGESTKDFSLALTYRARGVAVSESSLYAWLVAQMKTALPDDQRLLPVTLDRAAISVTALNEKEGSARLFVKAEGRSLLRETSAILNRARFVGRTPAEVQSLLSGQGGIAQAQVRLSPFFLKRLPRLADHIRVEIMEQ